MFFCFFIGDINLNHNIFLCSVYLKPVADACHFARHTRLKNPIGGSMRAVDLIQIVALLLIDAV